MKQLDLFASSGVRTPCIGALHGHNSPPVAPPHTLSDAALIDAIHDATQSTCHAVADEAVRRHLRAAVPALEALCRRFKGFGQGHAVPEQMASLRAMAELGGPDAAAAVRRILEGGVVAAPGQAAAMRAAAALGCVLSEQMAVTLLQHAEPSVRAYACRCAPRTSSVAVLLVSLLEDLHPEVVREAAIALGQRGAAAARPSLLRLLLQAPTQEVLDALAGVADEDATVRIGRIAEQDSALRDAALAALEAIDTPRAMTLLERLAGRSESRSAC